MSAFPQFVTVVSKFTSRQRCGNCGAINRLNNIKRGVARCNSCAGYYSRTLVAWREARDLWLKINQPSTINYLIRAEGERRAMFYKYERQLALKGEWK